MKKNVSLHFKFAWCILPILLVFFSCEKDKITPKKESNDTPPVTINSVDESILDQIEFDGEMFVFDSWEEFETTEKYLADLVNQHNESFGEQYVDLDDEAFNHLIIEEGFNEFQPLIDFETQYNFHSKRQQMNAVVMEWLAHSGETLDVSTHPDNFPILSQEARTLFNEEGKIRVGEEVMQVDELTAAAIPLCLEESYKREVHLFTSSGLVWMVHTSSVRTMFFNLIQRTETSVAAYHFHPVLGIQPYRLRRMQAQVSGRFRDSCWDANLPPHTFNAQQGTGIFRRASQRTATYYKWRLPHPKFIQLFDIYAQGGTQQYPVGHGL